MPPFYYPVAMSTSPPSGQQFVLTFGDQRATVTEVGAGLRTYTVGDRDVIDGYREDEMGSIGRGQLLLPWPNRIEDGQYEFAGTVHQTPLTEPSRHNALHGLTRWVNWTAVEEAPDRVLMSLLLHPQEGYPFALRLLADYRLSTAGLTVRTRATNVGMQAAPYGAGHHPYLTVGTLIDEALLKLPALMRLEANDRLIPTGRLLPTKGTAFDFLELRPIGSLHMDTAFATLVPDTDGLIRVHVEAPGGGPAVTLWMEPLYRFVMVYTPDTIPQVSRRRRSLAIEPMTCAPNAFRSGDGLVVLQPGETWTGSWGILG
ncbi:MAG TPA: aldose 1-epimerase family protein [Candidatus Dormibacteraeota bacterium]|nr:aldose 1-epimerase family protein [Candidatus Dormibacteraeota bacterium]